MLQSPLIANVLAPYVAWGVGNDMALSLPYSMLATLLAAFIERPFAKAAGFERRALVYSIRANILSWMIGVLLVYIIAFRAYWFFFAMYSLAIPFSIFIEGGYLALVKRRSQSRLVWKPILIGNILSGFILMAILVTGLETGDALRRKGSSLVLFLSENKELMNTTVLYLCATLFLLILLVPVRLRCENQPTQILDRC